MSAPPTVWMAALRAGLPHHRVVGSNGNLRTACDRFVASPNGVKHGVRVHVGEAREMGQPCDKCWPPQDAPR